MECEIEALKSRIAELEAKYNPDCATCARYDHLRGCGWQECYGNAVNCYIEKRDTP